MVQEHIEIYEIGEPLPIAITGGPADLSTDDQKIIQSMSGAGTASFLGTLAVTWMLIIMAIALGIYLNHWAAHIAVICFIATRQNVLGLLTHEQAHRLGIRSQLGDVITNLFCAFPILISLEGYRQIHLQHHRKYFSENDPDYRRKQGKEWTFPQSWRLFLSTILSDLIGLNLIATVRGKKPDADVAKSGKAPSPAFRLGFYGAVLALLAYTNTWFYFLLYWIVPIATVLQVIVRWGAICEHRYNLVDPSIQESTPLIQPRWWEALLLPNLNFNLHVYHHWYPAIPFKKLPVVHGIYVRNGLINEQHVFNGYIGYLLFLLAQERTSTDEATKTQQTYGGRLTTT